MYFDFEPVVKQAFLVMANIMDYLRWRGDLSFEASAFNEVDNLILSELVYVSFFGIVPGVGEGETSLRSASERFFETYTVEEINARVSSTKVSAFMMREMAETARFGDIRLANYVDDVDLGEQSQFCAMTVQLLDGRMCVVYSGTDSTIVGWKENFNMSFLSETPGQLKAVRYLETVAAQNPLPLRIMGHSKGGNLAVYAATHTSPELMDRIEVIYSNDGPGFTEGMISAENYRRMIPRIHTIIPESSIVGMLLEHEEAYEVVASSGTGAGQHDVMSWEVEGRSLVRKSGVDGTAVLIDRTLKSWIYKMDARQREIFVDTLFGVLDEAGIRTVDDLAGINTAKLREIAKISASLNKESQEVVRDTVKRFLEEGGSAVREVLFKR